MSKPPCRLIPEKLDEQLVLPMTKPNKTGTADDTDEHH